MKNRLKVEVELEKNGFLDIKDLKIPKVGRFVVIRLKTIEDYEKEKELSKFIELITAFSASK